MISYRVRAFRVQRTRSPVRRVQQEVGEIFRLFRKVFQIKHAFGKAPEETVGAAFIDLAPRTQDRGRRIELFGERDEVVLIAARSVQGQDDTITRPLNPFVNEAERAYDSTPSRPGILNFGKVASI